MWDAASLTALITAIAGVIGAATALVTAYKAHQKVNAVTTQTPAGDSESASTPPAGPKSL